MLPDTQDNVVKGLGLMKSQWGGKPVITGVLQSWLEKLQDVEDTAEFYKNLSIYNATGDDLDRIGNLFGVKRQGRDDDFYRRLILSYISASSPKCSVDGIITSCKTYGNTELVDLWEHFPAHVEVYMGAGFSPNMYDIVKQMTPAGVSARVLVDNEGDSLVFAEESPIGQTLINDEGDIYTLENIENEPRRWQVSSIGDYVEFYEDRAYMAEIGDSEWTPMAEELFTTVIYQVGNIVDESGNELVDENSNEIIYTDFRYRS